MQLLGFSTADKTKITVDILKNQMTDIVYGMDQIENRNTCQTIVIIVCLLSSTEFKRRLKNYNNTEFWKYMNYFYSQKK